MSRRTLAEGIIIVDLRCLRLVKENLSLQTIQVSFNLSLDNVELTSLGSEESLDVERTLAESLSNEELIDAFGFLDEMHLVRSFSH